MGTLHNVTQLHPFVLSGDGAFLPILPGAEDRVHALLQRNASRGNRLSRVPAAIQDIDGQLDIFGMNTTRRKHEVDAHGKFLHIQPGGKHGYGSDLSELVELASGYLDDFWFFVLWNYQYADEYSKTNGTFSASIAQKLPTNDYNQYIANRLSGQTVTAYRYLVECGLWAKRAYEADAMEYGEQEAAIYIEDFPDAVETLNESLILLPNGPEAVAAINWYSCLLYTSPSPRDATLSRMPSSA